MYYLQRKLRVSSTTHDLNHYVDHFRIMEFKDLNLGPNQRHNTFKQSSLRTREGKHKDLSLSLKAKIPY